MTCSKSDEAAVWEPQTDRKQSSDLEQQQLIPLIYLVPGSTDNPLEMSHKLSSISGSKNAAHCILMLLSTVFLKCSCKMLIYGGD